MRKLLAFTSVLALALAFGVGGAAKADVIFPFDGDLVAYWSFDAPPDASPDDEATGGVPVADDGTFVDGAGYQGGSDLPPVVFNVDAMELDGAGDFMSVSDSADLDQAGDFTVSAWVALDPSAGANSLHTVVSKDTGAASQNYNLHAVNGTFAALFVGPVFVVSFTAAPGVGVVSSGTASCGGDFCAIGGGVAFVDGGDPLGTWRHIAGVYDDTAKTLKVYLDGSLDGEMTVTGGGSPKVNAEDVLIGTRTSGANDVNGLIDEVRVYDVALTDSDIGTLSGAGALIVNKNDDASPAPAVCAESDDADYDVIQDALDAAADGDIVAVCPDTYTEDLSMTTDNVRLVGLAGSKPTIEGENTVPAGFPLADPNIDIKANGVTVENFNIDSPATDGTDYSSGMVLTGTDITIKDNDFHVSCGNPGSQAIQTWWKDNAPDGLKDISGLLIDNNTFADLDDCIGDSLGYEAIFINQQTDAVLDGEDCLEGAKVWIKDNDFDGHLYRAVGVDRSCVNVGTWSAGNEICTDIGATDGHNPTDDFGNVPIGVKLWDFDGSDPNLNIKVLKNRIGGICTSGQFQDGVVVSSGVESSKIVHNTILGVNDDGIRLQDGADDNKVGWNIVTGAGSDGIRIDSDDNDVSDNEVDGSTHDGIDVGSSEGSTAGGNHVTGNDVTDSGDVGIDVRGDGNTIDDNDVTGSENDGIRVVGNDNYVINNADTVDNNGDDGINIRGDGNTVDNNTVTGNGDDGIQIRGDDNDVSDNTVDGNGDDGIYVTGSFFFILSTGNEIFGNDINYNDGDGIHLQFWADANPVHNNSIGNNGDGGNRDHGIQVDGDHNILEKNSTHHSNSGDGIYIHWLAHGTIVNGNNSHHNGDCGFETDGQNTDFGTTGRDRNKAKHNLGPTGPNIIPCGHSSGN